MQIKIGKGLILKQGLPKGFIITDRNIAKIYSSLINKREKFVINPGEKSKNFANYKKILECLCKSDVNQIIALGGGVVGDLAGFVASTYKRGISLIHIPTSFLAMVDSSIGGKTGINLNENKNYVGTFYQPDAVLIDPLFLKTLPKEEFRNGLAEVIKYSMVFGKPNLDNVNDIIKECCKIKMKVVKKDERDKGYRHVLNFGHTIGHGIELLGKLKHGEAISIGMVKETELGELLGYVKKGRSEELKEILKLNHLPTKMPNINVDKIIELMKKDKKGSLVFAFNKKDYNVRVSEEIVRKVIQYKLGKVYKR